MFSGTLDDFTLPEILRMLAFSKKSGVLHVSRKAGTGRITFSDGAVVNAETELSSTRLGQKLLGAGKLTPGQLRESLDVQATTGERLGRVLLASEAVTKSDLEQAVRSQIEEAAYELMCWEAGEFSWQPGAGEPEAEISIDIEELMRDVETRLEQRTDVQLRLSKPGATPRMVEQAPHGPGDINIRPEQWRVLVLVDGRRSVGELALAAGVAEVDVIRTLNDLASAGLVEVREEDAAPSSAGPSEPDGVPPEPPETRVDPSTTTDNEVPEPQSEPDPPAADTPGTSNEAKPPEEWFEDPEIADDPDGLSVAFPPPEPAVEDLPRVDRASAVRELSGLFDEPKAPKPPPSERPEPTKDPDTKSLVSRLTRRPSQ